MSLSGSIWAYLEPSGAIWAYLNLSGPIWVYLGSSGPYLGQTPNMAKYGPSGLTWLNISLYGLSGIRVQGFLGFLGLGFEVFALYVVRVPGFLWDQGSTFLIQSN